MRTTWRPVAGLVLLALVLTVAPLSGSGVGSPRAAAGTPLRFVSGWIPVWNTNGLTALQANQGNQLVMSDPSPFNYSVTSATGFAMSSLYSANLTTVTRSLRANGLPVIPSLTDGISGGVEEGMATMLRDQMDVHVQAIVNLVMTGVDGIAFDGIDLDYEGFAFDDLSSSWGRTQPVWTEFVRRLGLALDAQGKVLSVTVPVGVNPATAYSVYDWRGIIPSIDRLRLMTYDFSWSVAGPVSPQSWVQTTINYVKGLVLELGRDPKMVQIGVPTYGRNWARTESGSCPASVLRRVDLNMKAAKTLAAGRGVVPTRHSSGELTFSYTEQFTSNGVRLGASATTSAARDSAVSHSGRPAPPVVDTGAGGGTDLGPSSGAPVSGASLAEIRTPLAPAGLAPAERLGVCTVRRTVFFPDEYTVVQRAQMALDAGLGGIAIWAFGYESPELWPLLRTLGDQYGAP